MTKDKDLYSRREFFRKSASTCLPILGAIALAAAPIKVSAAKAQQLCGWGCSFSCVSNCAMMCNGSCSGACGDGCSFSCENYCSTGCSSCVGKCKIGCGGCDGTCIELCSSVEDSPTFDFGGSPTSDIIFDLE